jgi:hypothetical protein
MSSIIEGYNYDIFISYRQKDNKYDGWVTEFVDNLKKELEATFKEEISVYFDINPHDGLLETYDVDASLKEKLKCLVFIPIISRTYCDPKSFAWENEFNAFIEQASNDQFGLKIRLQGGNVSSRVLPVRIHDLNKEDIKLCELALGGPLRGIEFIYKASGVNRPLRANEDHAQDNLNKTYYRDQINKLAHSIHEIFDGLRAGAIPNKAENDNLQEQISQLPRKKIMKAVRTKSRLPARNMIIFLMLLMITVTAFIIIYFSTSDKKLVKEVSSTEILNKAISAIDPYNSWGSYYKGKIRLRNIRTNAESEYDEIIEVDTKNGDYRRTYGSGHQQKVMGIKDGECYSFTVRNNINSGENPILNDSTDCESILWWRRHHYLHLGYLMELKKSGLILNKKAVRKEFHGNDCLALTFISNDSKVQDYYYKGVNFKVFIDPLNYSYKGFTMEDPKSNMNIYGIAAGSVRVNELKIPLCLIFYNSSDDSFIGIDIVTPVN